MPFPALPVGPIIPVRDTDRARAFFEDTLGLEGDPAPAGHRLRAGDGTVLYLLESSDYPGGAAWPLASFRTDDIKAAAAELRDRGVELLQFEDGPQKTDERGISDQGVVRIVWFQDPDDNTFTVFEPVDG